MFATNIFFTSNELFYWAIMAEEGTKSASFARNGKLGYPSAVIAKLPRHYKIR